MKLSAVGGFLRRGLLRAFASLLPLEPRRIRLLAYGYSGSNTAALFEALPPGLKEAYDVRLVPNYRPRGALASLRYVADLARASVVVSTHGYPKWKPRQRHVELWHGFPLKGMNLMDAAGAGAGPKARPMRGFDLVPSYSALYSSLMNACMGLDASRFSITGAPRNDLLWREGGAELLDAVLKKPTEGRSLVFYLPTYRSSIAGRVDGDPARLNIFGLESFDAERSSRFLRDKGIRLVAKLHPFEERVFLKAGGIDASGGIEILTEKALAEAGVELYRILAAADALVTDYSSVYFDLLLRDLPLLFLPVDLEAYRESRGFLLEPYEFWAPGPKVADQEGLERELLRLLEDRSYYSKERATVRDIVHAYKDDRSCERVWAAILGQAPRDGAMKKEMPR